MNNANLYFCLLFISCIFRVAMIFYPSRALTHTNLRQMTHFKLPNDHEVRIFALESTTSL